MSYYVKIDFQKVVQIRKKKKITQQKLARMSGLSISTIQAYEQGRFEPKPSSVDKICNALAISLEEIATN